MRALIAVLQSGPTTPGCIRRLVNGLAVFTLFTEVPRRFVPDARPFWRTTTHLTVPVHWHYQSVTGKALLQKKRAAKQLRELVRCMGMHLELGGDFNYSLRDDVAFVRRSGFSAPMAPTPTDAQARGGTFVDLFTTDHGCSPVADSRCNKLQVPGPWQAENKLGLRRWAASLKGGEVTAAVQAELFGRHREIVLAADTPAMLDHAEPRWVMSSCKKRVVGIVAFAGANGLEGEEKLAIFPLFGYALRFIATELSIDTTGWARRLSECFYEEVLHITDSEREQLIAMGPERYTHFPLSFPPVMAFFQRTVLSVLDELSTYTPHTGL